MSSVKKSKLFIALLLFVVAISFAGYNYVYQDHKTTADLSADFKGTAKSMLEKIQDKPESWTNKIVELKGTVGSITKDGFNLSSSIFCQMNDNRDLQKLQKNKSIVLKGRIIGYDDLLEELKLDKCILIK